MPKKIILTSLGSILLLGFILFLCLDARTKEFHDIKNYNKYLNDLKNSSDVHSKLYIFPKEIIDQNAKLTYLYREGLFGGSYFFYLEETLDSENYKKEQVRIQNMKITYKKEEKTPLYITEKYEYLITINDNLGTYEYAILDKEHLKIIYIFNQLYTEKENELEEEYQLSSTKKINIYYIYDKDGNGTIIDEEER